VALASLLSDTPDSIRRIADANVGDIVMFSLFEERLRERAVQITRLVESFMEALKRPVGQPMPSTMMAT
jgi:dihydroorotate dehydrogenase (fumarate)